MITRKKKLSKKEIKEDKLVSFLYKIESFYEENKRRIFTYGIIFLVVVGAVYIYMNQIREENEKAGLELSRVMNLFDSGSYLEAIEGRQGTNIIGLKRIVEEYGSTENGETAKIYLANAYSYLGNYDEAIKYYEDYSGDIDVLKASAKAGIAGYYATKQDYKKAADLYKEASSVTDINPQNPDYMLDAAVNYIEAGDKEESKVLLNKIKDDYKTSNAYKEVDKYLALAND
ncbi:tetratricopeptide repeat protein [bacterium BMS3Abin03]|jgi:tetratricopeptide (TPR) repeat protein|nr:tetratricopeptide repeat protein [bacterium BMS3Abin03]MCG6959754.1 tetratricopeptide repeat protein [bacterium BMS3Abin03]